jgi:hypothetical protein
VSFAPAAATDWEVRRTDTRDEIRRSRCGDGLGSPSYGQEADTCVAHYLDLATQCGPLRDATRRAILRATFSFPQVPSSHSLRRIPKFFWQLGQDSFLRRESFCNTGHVTVLGRVSRGGTRSC